MPCLACLQTRFVDALFRFPDLQSGFLIARSVVGRSQVSVVGRFTIGERHAGRERWLFAPTLPVAVSSKL